MIGLIFLSRLELAGVRTLRTVVKMADRLIVFKRRVSSVIMQRCIHFIPGGNWNPMQGDTGIKWYIFCILDPFHHDKGGTEVWICVLGLCSHQLEASALCSRRGCLLAVSHGPWTTDRSCMLHQEERTGDGHGSDSVHGSVFHSVSVILFFPPHKTCELPDSLNALLDHPEGP